jgi:hypothetical protein
MSAATPSKKRKRPAASHVEQPLLPARRDSFTQAATNGSATNPSFPSINTDPSAADQDPFADLSAQLRAATQSGDRPGISPPIDASTTAAAALAQYTNHDGSIPDHTSSFATGSSGTADDARRGVPMDTSFDLGRDSQGPVNTTGAYPFQGAYAPTINATNGAGKEADDTNGAGQGRSDSQDAHHGHRSGSGSGGHGKPTVGSDEWNKIRRDNHKEGSFPPSPVPPIPIIQLTRVFLQSNAAAAKP